MMNRSLTTIVRGFLLLALFAGLNAPLAYGQLEKEGDRMEAKAAYIDGLSAFENEEYEKALELLMAAYVRLPQHPGVNFALADAYLQVDDLPNAAYYGKQAVKLEPGNKWFRLKLADIYRRAGKNQATIDELQAALGHHPRDADLLYELARTYTDQGEPLKSNNLYNRLLNIRGPDINVYLQKLKNFSDLGMRDSSIVQLQNIRELDPDNLSTMHLLSEYYQRMDRQKEAKQVLKQALRQNRRDPKTLIMLSDIYRAESQWDSVTLMLGNVVSDTVVSPESKLTIAKYLYTQFKQNSRNTEVRAATGKVLEQFRQTEPGFGQAHALSADFYAQTGQHARAIEALEKTTELMPSSDSAWRQRLQLLLAEGRTGEAVAAGEKAAAEIPQDPVILYLLGHAYLSNRDNARAVESLVEAADLPARKPLKSNILGSLGDAYAGLERWEEAFQSYESSLELDPQNPVVLNNYAYFLSLRKQQLDKAKKMAQKALEMDSGNPSYLDTMGWIYYRQGEFEKARKYIQASIETGRASAEVLEHMGDVLEKLGRREEAKTWWEKALEKDASRTHLKEKINH